MKKCILCCVCAVLLAVSVSCEEVRTDKPNIAIGAFTLRDENQINLINDVAIVQNMVRSHIVKTGKCDVTVAEEANQQKLTRYVVTGSVDVIETCYIVSVGVQDLSDDILVYSDSEFVGQTASSLYKGVKKLTERFMKEIIISKDGKIEKR